MINIVLPTLDKKPIIFIVIDNLRYDQWKMISSLVSKDFDVLDDDIYYSIPKKILTGLKFLLFRKGPLTVGASYACGFIKSDPHLETPNLQFHISPASTDVLGKASLHKFPAFTPTITNVR